MTPPTDDNQADDIFCPEEEIVSEVLPSDKCTSKREKREQEFGLRKPCVLNILPNFHTCLSMPIDLMHDALEGSVAEDCAEAIMKLVEKKKLSLKKLNETVKDFDYSSFKKDDKPLTLKY